MSRRQAWVARGLFVAWLLATVWFWSWWLRPEHFISWSGTLLNSAQMAWATALPAVGFVLVIRMRRPNPDLLLPPGRAAMIVTKTATEPWPVVRRTLNAMLCQRLSDPSDAWRWPLRRTPQPVLEFDVWLADEAPTAETRSWCARNGVGISSRQGVAAYNGSRWPGRARSKEGNLRFFYEAAGGYDRYDFVVQLDADHVPTQTYLREMLRPFADPRVGYVAAPSIGDGNATESWAARARLNSEALLHGPWQAGANSFAPLCFGSHYAVRTAALREVGGLGPELAEDHSTSLMLSAAGWRGVFAIDAVANGDGPATLSDALTQELQWSRSLVRVLTRWTPRLWGSLSWRSRFSFGFAQLWYPALAAWMLTSYVLPPLALASRSPLVAVDLVEWLMRSLAMASCVMVGAVWLRSQGWLRPVDARLLSWETGLYELIRWPWVLAGVIQAILGWLARRDFGFRVTPKGAVGARALPLTVLTPLLLLGVVQSVVAIMVNDAGQARGYYAFCLLNAAAYTCAGGAVLILHLHEMGGRGSQRVLAVLRTLVTAVPLLAVALLTLLLAIQLRAEAATREIRAATALPVALAREAIAISDRDVVSRLQTIAGLAGIHVGAPPVPTEHISALDLPAQRVAVGAYDPRLTMRDQRLDLEHWFLAQHEPQRLSAALVHARNRRTLMVTIEPHPTSARPGPVLESVVSGAFDDDLRQLAARLREAAPQVVLVRWAHEMEVGGLYPWAANNPEVFRAAFRHVVQVFREQGASNARFVWSPAGFENAGAYFPGRDVVDLIGLTVLADAEWDWHYGLPPQSFADIMGPRYHHVAQFDKPIVVAELGVSGSPERQAAWLTQAVESLHRFPLVRALVYFADKNPPVAGIEHLPDWQLEPSILRDFADGVAQASLP